MRAPARLLILASSLAGLCLWTGAASAQKPRVRVETNHGNFVVELEHERSPLTVEHFLTYVNDNHYEGTVFHRVVHGFLAQAGGYTVDIELKPGADRTVPNESGNGLSNMRGTVGMARTNEPHSATSQFYVNLSDNLDLNPRPSRWGYTVFGTVVEGMDIIDEIGHRPTGSGGEFPRDVPVDPIVIERITLLEESRPVLE